MTNRSFGFEFYFCVSLSSSDPGSSSVRLGISVNVFPDNILHSDSASLRQPEQFSNPKFSIRDATIN